MGSVTYVGDDVGVQGIALSRIGNKRSIRGEEGTLSSLAVELSTTKLKVHGGRAGAKVSAGEGRGAGGGVGRAGDADHGTRGEGEEGGEDDSGGKHFECLYLSEEDRLVEKRNV